MSSQIINDMRVCVDITIAVTIINDMRDCVDITIAVTIKANTDGGNFTRHIQ